MGACVGLALTPVYWLLLVLRMAQAFGSSSTIAIGAGVVGDVVEPAKRGGYFGIYSAGQLIGVVIGPVIGGILAEELSWRATALISVLLFVPETLRSLVGNGSGYANPTPFQWWAHRKDIKQKASLRRFLVLPNFMAPFRYLFEPDIFIGLLFNGLHYAAYYCYLIVNTNLFETQYGLNSLQVGLTFLCNGSATIIGSLIQGKVLDRDYRITKEKHSADTEFPIHWARLRSVWIHAALAQIVTLLYGWCAQIHAPLAVLLVLQFIGKDR
ncbi:hypothetical protein DFQ28_000183 [Apophysomyces sp. BC1034]|nr:hypothetical protein DFQ30_000374 [Apophysomyces sp. BC1015]KAG0178976.1 hypothetical protein DFQ29_002771 [Apophysomyces sp. BC1021]KAG0184074.1 hypothetical protein DFQ28_000183 [Apophysomyces sp. BC1034]